MKRIINYIAAHNVCLNVILVVYDAATIPSLLNLDVSTHKNLYLIWSITQVPFAIFNIIKICKTKDWHLCLESYLVLIQTLLTLWLIYFLYFQC